MRLFNRLSRHWPTLLASGAALLALALLWVVRDAPLRPAPGMRVDALGAFFIFASLAGLALALIARPGSADAPRWRILALGALLIAAFVTALTPVIAGAYLLFALMTLQWGSRSASASRSRLRAIGDALRHTLLAAPGLIAAGALLVGYSALAARGALRYDERTAGAALDGFAFWFVLLAAVIPISALGRTTNDERRTTNDERGESLVGGRWSVVEQDLFRVAWLYPLVRLYSLGPWNNGWSFAALLLGGGAALWAATAALARRPAPRELALVSHLGLALAGFGLGTSAGIAAGCYGVLAYLVLALRPTADDRHGGTETRRHGDEGTTDNEQQTTDGTAPSSFVFRPSSLMWLLSGAIPLTAPFVAAWMLVGASVAGGVVLLAGAAWLVMLLNGLTTALARAPAAPDARRPLLIAAGASVTLGVGAPLVVVALIQPVIEQLQGGLAPYGDVDIWPWVGLAAIDAAHTQVTTLPSIAVAALMLVLSALVYLLVRLRDALAPPSPSSGADHAASAAGAPTRDLGDLLAILRDEVPWLGGSGPRPASEERRVDGE